MNCNASWCDRQTVRVQHCSKHRQQMKKFGKVFVTKYDKRKFIDKGDHYLIPLGVLGHQGFAKVDKDLLYLEDRFWSLNTKGYPQTTIMEGEKPVTRLLHKIVMGYDKELVVDHINRDKLDNRRSNLRFVTCVINQHNRSVQCNNQTGYKNVVKYGKNFRGDIKVNDRRLFTDVFPTPAEAYSASQELRLGLGLPL